jgi:hypothetical protein
VPPTKFELFVNLETVASRPPESGLLRADEAVE